MQNKIPNTVKDIASFFSDAGYEINLVGGCVRDLLMNIEPHDWDMNTNATPDCIIELCKKHGLRYSDVGLKHGTITIYIKQEDTQQVEGYEITTYRLDGDYSDGRHPDDVVFTDNLKEDLSRRDFTMNAIAMNINTGEIIDPFNGQTAIIEKKLIAVGDANHRIEEDALRMLRALRFAIKYDLTIDEKLEDAIHNHVADIHKIAKERITDEFKKMFATEKSIQNEFMRFVDFIAEIIPEIKPCIGFEQNNKFHKHDVYEHMLSVTDLCESTKFEIKLAALLHDIGKPNSYTIDENGYGHFYGHPVVSTEITKHVLQHDFSVSNAERDRILELVEFHDMIVTPSLKSMRKTLSKHGVDFMQDWLILKQADMDDHIYPDGPNVTYPLTVQPLYPLLQQVLDESLALTLKDLKINGNIIMEAYGLKPGKYIGTVLNELLELVIDETIGNDPYVLLQVAGDLLIELGIIEAVDLDQDDIDTDDVEQGE